MVAFLVAPLLVTGLGPVANAATLDPPTRDTVTISGTVTDPVGPADADVCVRNLAGGLLDPRTVGTRTDAQGRYELTVPRGEYEVTVRHFSPWSPCASHRQEFDKYTHQTRRISTAQHFGPLDFDMKFHITNATVGSGSRPGGLQQVGGYFSRDAPEARMFWDDGAGNEYEVTPKRKWGEPYNYGHPIWLYVFDRTVPDLPDGTYTGTLRVESVDDPGLVLADPSVETYVVDSVAPVVTATFPADGATDGATQRSFLRFDAHSGTPPPGVTETAGVVCYRSSVVLDDITGGGRVRVLPAFGWDPNGRNWYDWAAGPRLCETDDPYDLVAGHEYEATITVRDFAGNTSTHTSSFTAYDGPDFFDPSPVGSGPAPERISVRFSPDARPYVDFRVFRTDRPEEITPFRDARFDTASRTAWIRTTAEEADTSAWWPVLEPGTYRVEVTGRDWHGADLDPLVWTFEVELPVG